MRGLFGVTYFITDASLVTTGEENEETLYQVRGKLFTLGTGNQWKERGTGMLKLNVQKADGSSPRLGEYVVYYP